MADNRPCIFCGKVPGFWGSCTVTVADIPQQACTDCSRELRGLSELELCQRALESGLAAQPEKIREHIAFVEEVDAKRPKCSVCGTPMVFRGIQTLDASPMRDGIFTSTFDVLPMYCPNCCKMELFWPEMLERNKELAHLYRIDCK